MIMYEKSSQKRFTVFTNFTHTLKTCGDLNAGEGMKHVTRTKAVCFFLI